MNSIEVENMTKVFRVLHRQGTMKSEMLNLLRCVCRAAKSLWLCAISRSRCRRTDNRCDRAEWFGQKHASGVTGAHLSPERRRIRVRGRVATLLELGAGFNTEFTGIENVFSTV
jgi:hypothetical protein